MNEKKIEPTDAMVRDLEFRKKLVAMGPIGALRYVLNHPDAAGLFECDHTDYVHVDEAATRVEAARLEGWDGAVDWIEEDQDGTTRSTIAARNANPYRSSPELPTKPGAVIVPADGCEAITATLGSETYHAREAILFSADAWLGAWRDTAGARAYMGPTRITPGTWQVDDQ